ncbi:MAG TPA: SpoIVB peptidase S55 domain-containing protein, partial [Actinomycetota bacterium]|nr:SpoIVB peptidase S55 domain-containing protein [Actinomycetota bacterium]
MFVPRSVQRRRLGALAGVISLLLLGTMLAGLAPAQVRCDAANLPPVIPQEDLVPGMLGNGVTALAGATPRPFTFEVVGTIPDGWMLGLDAIVIHITGPQEFLDETGGVFFGMSGSPAYVEGDLAGAVSGAFYDDPTFGLLTPAEAMLDVMEAAQAPRMTPKVTLVPTDAIRRAIARIQGESVSSVTGTFQQLPTPLAVSGLSRRQAAELQARLDERGENFHVYRAASAKTTAAALDPTQFKPGEPLGAAIAYGDASYYATGTATFTCNDYVAAFGHPFFYDAPGEISLGLSGAEGLMVLKPLGWPGSRLALLTEPRGTIVQDRF